MYNNYVKTMTFGAARELLGRRVVGDTVCTVLPLPDYIYADRHGTCMRARKVGDNTYVLEAIASHRLFGPTTGLTVDELTSALATHG